MTIKNKLDTFWEEFLEPIDEKVIYGNYSKPKILNELKDLSSKNLINLEWIGFYLYPWMPFAPQPIDMIPFASTGVDGTFFAFLTDFGSVESLEKAPIIMYCTTDFNYKNTTKGYTLIARNLMDFISISTQIYDPYLVYLEDPVKLDFENEILDLLDDDSEEDSIARLKTVEKIKETFELPKIANLNEYYNRLFSERVNNTNIKTKDGLGISNKNISDLPELEISQTHNKKELHAVLDELNTASRIKYYRDYGYLYKNLHESRFLYVLEVLIKFLGKDKFYRESKVLEFDLKKQKAYHRYHKLKKKHER